MEKIKSSPKREVIEKDEPALAEITPEIDEEEEEREQVIIGEINDALEEEDKSDAKWDEDWERHKMGGVN